jgi:hypothetical protein
VDQAGCGAGLRGNACATIAFAASLARESGGLPATISVANPPNGKDWIGDPFPINLDEGIALSAPGLYFYDPGWSPEPTELFLVGNLSQAANPMPSIIEGSAGAPIHIGVDSLGNVTPVGTGILVREGALRLLAAELLVPEWDWLNSGVLVDTGGALTLGTDGLGSSGTVWIGAPDAGQGAIGIRCGTPSSSGLMTIDDQGSTASPSLWTQNLITGIHAPNCAVNLSAGPRFGLALNEAGGCDSRADQFCLFSGGAWSGAVRNAIFQCCTLGLTIAGDYTMDNDVFQFNGTGVSVGPDGSPTSAAPRFTNCSFHDNDIGIGTTGRVDLSGGGNQISCNRTGGLVVSQGVGSVVSAEHVAWDLWDPMAGHTEIWECVAPVRGTVWSCTCTGASTCPSDTLTTPPPGAPAVYYRDQPQPRPDDANGSQSPSACR